MLQIVKVCSPTHFPSLSQNCFKILKEKFLFKRIATPALLLAMPLNKAMLSPIQPPKVQRNSLYNEPLATCKLKIVSFSTNPKWCPIQSNRSLHTGTVVNFVEYRLNTVQQLTVS